MDNELAEAAQDHNLSVSALLRKALVAARKYDEKDFENWITSELKGYSIGVDLPEYRVLSGNPVAFMQGSWQRAPIHNLNEEMVRKLTVFYFRKPISELESYASSSNTSIIITYSAETENMLVRAMNFPSTPALKFNRSQFKKVLEIVRTTVLEYALKLDSKNEESSTSNVSIKSDLPRARHPVIAFLNNNKSWLFEGIGTESLKWIGGVVFVIISGSGFVWWMQTNGDKLRSSTTKHDPAFSEPNFQETSSTQNVAVNKTSPAAYTFQQLRDKMHGKTKIEVVKLLGKPFTASDYDNGNETWAYQNIAYEEVTGKIASVTVISFVNGKVESVSFG